MSTLRLVWELIRYRPGRFFYCFAMWTIVHGLPLAFGILIAEVFDRLAAGSPVDETAWAPAIVFAVLAIAGFIHAFVIPEDEVVFGGRRVSQKPLNA